jgi:hypothetical protein
VRKAETLNNDLDHGKAEKQNDKMDPPPTILGLKLAFINEQIQSLSKPLRVPASYRPLNPESGLREKSINTALARLNDSIRKHSKLVYSAQARRHIAEQIDTLYWQAGETDIVTGNWEGLQISDDLSELNTFSCLFGIPFHLAYTHRVTTSICLFYLNMLIVRSGSPKW